MGSKVIIAPGHSARGMYRHLIDIGVQVEPKPFSVGFRVEHPQALVDTAQYGEHIAAQVQRGKGKVPVADYRLSANVEPDEVEQVCCYFSKRVLFHGTIRRVPGKHISKRL